MIVPTILWIHFLLKTKLYQCQNLKIFRQSKVQQLRHRYKRMWLQKNNKKNQLTKQIKWCPKKLGRKEVVVIYQKRCHIAHKNWNNRQSMILDKMRQSEARKMHKSLIRPQNPMDLRISLHKRSLTWFSTFLNQ